MRKHVERKWITLDKLEKITTSMMQSKTPQEEKSKEYKRASKS